MLHVHDTTQVCRPWHDAGVYVYVSLQDVGIDALADGLEHANVMLRLQLLLVEGWLGRFLRKAFEYVYRRTWYDCAINALLCALVLLVFFDVRTRHMGAVGYHTLYGALFCVLGLDVALTATFNLVHSRPIHHQRERESHHRLSDGHLFFEVFLMPFLWMAAMVQLLHARPTHGSLLLGHYITPVLLVVRNEFLWMSVWKFAKAIYGAASIVYLLGCTIIVMAALGVSSRHPSRHPDPYPRAPQVPLLHGQYDEGDAYVDEQFQDCLRVSPCPCPSP